jgi:CHAT domain-containing protein
MIGMMGDIYLGRFRLAWDQLHNGPKAFRIIESARGRALFDSIRYGRQSGPTKPHTVAEQDIARLQRVLLHARLNAAQTRRVVAQLDAAYDRLSSVEYVRNRKEMELARRPPVSLAVLRRQLGPKDVLVEYVLDASSSYAIRVTKADLTIHRLPGRAAINRMVNSYLAAIRNKSNSTGSAQALYASLISPVVTQHPSALIIVPDGSLHLLPFASLVDGTGAYLENTLTVSAAPSATVYSALNAASRESGTTRPFLGIAYAAAQNSNSPQGSGIRGFLGADLKPLQFGREEIVEAAQRLGRGSVTLAGSAATESALKAQPLREFEVVHIAAHGVGNDSEPDRAALVLEPGSQSEDGLWQAREIRQSRINAEIVVLSACETGRGRLQGQEGVMNLARAFLTAGAKSVVASLWAVDDRSTATLMESFYDHLAKGSSVAEALRQAQLDFIRDYGDKAQPYFWAGFEVIGDGTRRIAFETKKPNVTTARRSFR